MAREGQAALSLSDDSRIAVLHAEPILKSFGKSVRWALDYGIQYLQKSQQTITVRALVDEYLALKKTKGNSASICKISATVMLFSVRRSVRFRSERWISG